MSIPAGSPGMPAGIPPAPPNMLAKGLAPALEELEAPVGAGVGAEVEAAGAPPAGAAEDEEAAGCGAEEAAPPGAGIDPGLPWLAPVAPGALLIIEREALMASGVIMLLSIAGLLRRSLIYGLFSIIYESIGLLWIIELSISGFESIWSIILWIMGLFIIEDTCS